MGRIQPGPVRRPGAAGADPAALFERRALGPLVCALCLTAGAAQARHHHADGHHAIIGRPQIGRASYYGTHEAGRKTASGARLNPGALTAAHRTLPFGTKVRVTNKRNGRTVTVRINDRGPFIRGRVIDLTPAAANALGFSGLAPVTLAR